MHAQIIQDRFRRHYRLHTPDDVFINIGVQPESFRDPVLTEQFVRDLRVPEDYWQRIVTRCGQWNSQPDSSPEGRISQLLIEGRIRLYPLTHANRGFAIDATQHYPAITTDKGRINQLVPASVLLTGPAPKIKSFSSKQQAEQFLSCFGPDDTQLNNVLQASGLTGIQSENNTTTKTARIVQAMLDGKLVVIEKQQGVTATKEGKAEELPAQGPVTKPATLGPHEGGDNNIIQVQNTNTKANSNTEHRIARLEQEGHAPARHGGPNRVTDQQLEDRAVSGIDPASGTIFDAYNKNPDGTPKLHKVGRNATAFASDDALLKADDFARSSKQYQQNVAAAKESGDMFVDPVELPLKDVFGDNYKDMVRGVTRLGSKNNPAGHVATDFTNGTIKAIYRIDQNGNVNLHTLYPNPV